MLLGWHLEGSGPSVPPSRLPWAELLLRVLSAMWRHYLPVVVESSPSGARSAAREFAGRSEDGVNQNVSCDITRCYHL
jgi:hypothetical protein